MLVLFHMHEIRSSRDSLSALTSYLRGEGTMHSIVISQTHHAW